MRRCKPLTTGDVTYQYSGGVGPSPKAGAKAGAGSTASKSATGTARLITAQGEYRRRVGDPVSNHE